ncbi:MAG: hypothetical protein KJ927_05765, partial [Candidatus Eisenbacteria bacterium]|nr:hypothetical protein [Candidatus Eisenbacteria bacterium]
MLAIEKGPIHVVRFNVSPGFLRALFVILILASMGCQQASTVGGPSQVFIDPSFTERKIESLVFVGTYSGVMDDQAKNIVNAYLVPLLTSEQHRFFIVNDQQARTTAQKAGREDLFTKVQDVWMDHRKVDPNQAKELCEILHV